MLQCIVVRMIYFGYIGNIPHSIMTNNEWKTIQSLQSYQLMYSVGMGHFLTRTIFDRTSCEYFYMTWMHFHAFVCFNQVIHFKVDRYCVVFDVFHLYISEYDIKSCLYNTYLFIYCWYTWCWTVGKKAIDYRFHFHWFLHCIFGTKRCIFFATAKIRNTRNFLRQFEKLLSDLAVSKIRKS